MISMLAVLPAAPPLCVCVHWALRLGWEGRDGNVITQCEPNPVRMRDQFCQNGVWEGGSLQAAWVAWSVGCWSSSCSFFVCLSISSADGLQQECFWLHISQVLGESLQIRKIIHSIVIHNAIVCHVIVCHVYVNVCARACLSWKRPLWAALCEVTMKWKQPRELLSDWHPPHDQRLEKYAFSLCHRMNALETFCKHIHRQQSKLGCSCSYWYKAPSVAALPAFKGPGGCSAIE